MDFVDSKKNRLPAPPERGDEGKPISSDFKAAFEASFKRNEEALRRLAKL